MLRSSFELLQRALELANWRAIALLSPLPACGLLPIAGFARVPAGSDRPVDGMPAIVDQTGSPAIAIAPVPQPGSAVPPHEAPHQPLTVHSSIQSPTAAPRPALPKAVTLPLSAPPTPAVQLAQAQPLPPPVRPVPVPAPPAAATGQMPPAPIDPTATGQMPYQVILVPVYLYQPGGMLPGSGYPTAPQISGQMLPQPYPVMPYGVVPGSVIPPSSAKSGSAPAPGAPLPPLPPPAYGSPPAGGYSVGMPMMVYPYGVMPLPGMMPQMVMLMPQMAMPMPGIMPQMVMPMPGMMPQMAMPQMVMPMPQMAMPMPGMMPPPSAIAPPPPSMSTTATPSPASTPQSADVPADADPTPTEAPTTPTLAPLPAIPAPGTTATTTQPLLRRTALNRPELRFQGVYLYQGDAGSGRARVTGTLPVSPNLLFGGTVDFVDGRAFTDSQNQGISLNELYLAASLPSVPNLRLVVGQLDLTSYFDRNSFAKDGASMFFNSAFQTNPALAASGIGSRQAALLNWSITDFAEAKAAMFSSARDLSDFSVDGFAGELGLRQGNFIVRGSYATNRDGGRRDSFREIFQIDRGNGRSGVLRGDREEAFGINTEIFIPELKLGIFGRYGQYTNQGVNRTANTYNVGITLLDLFMQRDRLGIAYGQQLSNDRLRRQADDRLPDAFEVFYDFAVLPNLRLGFSFQSTDNFSETILGVRVKTDFNMVAPK